MSLRTVAIIGRPNVGKSTLFNRLIRRRKAIVDHLEGITRDRIIETVEWRGYRFELVDTGGFIPDADDQITKAVAEQVKMAVEESDLVLLMVDGRTPVTHYDSRVAEIIKRSGTPCILVVNKVDNELLELEAYVFMELGLGEPLAISALNGRNIGNLMDEIIKRLPPAPLKEDKSEGIRFSIVGMPNVGKSSLVNAILGKEQAIVTDIPGTTRDSIDSHFRYYGEDFTIVDTAGLRRKSKIKDRIEYYSTIRTLRSLKESDVAVVVIDLQKGFGHHDRGIVKQVIDMGRGMVVALNKWDLIPRDSNTMQEYRKNLLVSFPELVHYPLLFVSARTRKRVFRIVEEVREVYHRRQHRVSTSELNDYFQQLFRTHPPPATQGRYIKINYVTQVATAPPLFVFFTNFPELVPHSYRRFLEHKIRERWDYTGVPLKVSFRRK